MNVGVEYKSNLMFDNIVFTMEESEQKIIKNVVILRRTAGLYTKINYIVTLYSLLVIPSVKCVEAWYGTRSTK